MQILLRPHSHSNKEQTMSKKFVFTLAALLALPGLTVMAADSKTTTKTPEAKVKGDKPAASPGWIIIEEDFWYPLRFEPLFSFDAARTHYRRNEEKAAAGKIDQAVSWLKLAAGHAMPITKEKLTTAATDLEKVAKDLRSGNLTDAAKMDSALASASKALGEWHYFKAKESWGKSEEQDAGRDLAMAAEYLQHAANSAHYQFGPDTREVITKTYDHGKVASTTTHFDHNTLGTHLDGIKKAIKELSDVMKK